MVRPNPSGLINSLRQTAESRVTISQLTWLVAVAVACVVGVRLGTPVYLGLVAFAIALLPVVSWGIGRSGLNLSEHATGNLTVFSWLLVMFAGLAISGGAMSSLAVILLLGPFAAMGFGRTSVALEVLVLGFLAFGASISAGVLGWSETVPESWRALIAPLAFASIFQLGVMFWACAPILASGQFAADDSARIERNGATDREARATSGLDYGLPLILIRATAEGRIGAVYGPEHLRWPALEIGHELDLPDASGGDDMFSSAKGDRFKIVQIDTEAGGRWISLLPEDLLQSVSPRLKDDLQTAQARLKKAETDLVERTNFFAGLGHDLKTPLNAIIGFSELMKEEVRGPLPHEYKDYPAIIHESGRDLMLLVDDILDLAKSEAKAHRLELEPVDLVASGQSVGRQLADQAERAPSSFFWPP